MSPRPSRRTNLALLALLAGAFVTGWVAFAVEGSPESRAISVVHGVAGLGIRLDHLLGPLDGGSIVVRSVTGYARRFPPEDAASLLIATHVGGVPLSRGHGAPVRLVAPGRRGFWWVKWVEQVSVESQPSWLQSPFPLQ
jgi:hypothetical protein